jgi:hypothetical protein
MSDVEPPTPDAGHNLPPIGKLADEMKHHAGLWSRNAGQGEKHRYVIMAHAFSLRSHMEDPQLRVLIKGVLAEAEIRVTKRSGEFTPLLHFAFHKAEIKPEKSQISRWAGALQYAWTFDPRPAPETVVDWIKSHGGDVECAKRARKGSSALLMADGNSCRATRKLSQVRQPRAPTRSRRQHEGACGPAIRRILTLLCATRYRRK